MNDNALLWLSGFLIGAGVGAALLMAAYEVWLRHRPTCPCCEAELEGE